MILPIDPNFLGHQSTSSILQKKVGIISRVTEKKKTVHRNFRMISSSNRELKICHQERRELQQLWRKWRATGKREADAQNAKNQKKTRIAWQVSRWWAF